jgi:hypothetical protein
LASALHATRAADRTCVFGDTTAFQAVES